MRQLILTSILGLLFSQGGLAHSYVGHGGENEGPRAMVSPLVMAEQIEGQTVSYDGWISFNSSLNSFMVELQGAQPGVSGDDWAALELTTAAQEQFAREQYSSETRPLLHIAGEVIPGTGNPATHQLPTMKVSILEVAHAHAYQANAQIMESSNMMIDANYDSGVGGNCLEARPRPSPQCCHETGAHIPACGFTGP